MTLNIPSAYELVEFHPIKELGSDGYILRHKKTGARVVLLSNDDDNKVFYIGFRTPPTDSTGVAHILEHSVLCGSRDFPVKDPFIELAQGSLNTFLNAMTYPDKTVYPVASCNLSDLKNLMHVYLDAVFFPNIHKEEKIFRQEGWHYHLENPEDELTINGVVYNEMKGAFSSPDDVHYREVFNSLFPDTAYGVESGGDPDNIPDLTYEDFREFHKKYYHPSNSYIYLYGDMDMEERLNFLDRQYLSGFDKLEIDSMPKRQEAFDGLREVKKTYPITEGEPTEGNSYLSFNSIIGNVLDSELYLAFQVLDYALCSSPGAPVKKALTDAGIGAEVFSNFENGIMQPYFSITAKGTDESKKDRFLSIIKETLTEQVEKGINKKSIAAAINHFEFKYREADYGSYPKGLIYGLEALDSWLYSDELPFIHLEADNTFKSLKEKSNTGYFEELVKSYLLDNPHSSLVVTVPEPGLAGKRDEAFKEKMRAYKDSLSENELKAIVDDTKALLEYQSEENRPEDIARIPLLSIEDLKKEANEYRNEVVMDGDTKILYHDYFTNGVCYLSLLFDLKDVPNDLYRYLVIHSRFLGLVDTEHYAYGDLFNEVCINTGGITFSLNIHQDYKDFSKYCVKLAVNIKTLYDKIPEAIKLANEIITNSLFTDKKRLKEILSELKSSGKSSMISSAHSNAVSRVMATLSEQSALDELIGGISSYRLICSEEEGFDEGADGLIDKLRCLSAIVFRPENLMVDVTMGGPKKGDLHTDRDLIEADKVLRRELCDLKAGLFDIPYEKGSFKAPLLKGNEAFTSSAAVQFVCRGGDFRNKGFEYTGAYKVLKVIMSYDYLWNQVRVKGGAYGCMCGFSPNGQCYFVSYRDPHIKQTIDTYKAAADYIRNFNADERTMTKFIIGTISNMDTPLTPSGRGSRSLHAYLSNIDIERIQKNRDQVLSATASDIRALGDSIEAFMSDERLCVIGAEGKIKENSALFDKIEELV